MEEADKDWMMTVWWVGECFFWYQLTRIRTKGHKTVVVVVVFVALYFSSGSLMCIG